MLKSKQVWVSPTTGWWKVKTWWAKKAYKITKTKKEAVKAAEAVARKKWWETKVQKKDWRIQWWNSYGNDPFPPRDKNG